MIRRIVQLAQVGLHVRGLRDLTPDERRRVSAWLARTAPRFGRGRGPMLAAAAVVSALALAAGTLAAVPFYQHTHRELWEISFESLDELTADFTDGMLSAYTSAFAAHAGLIALAALGGALLWLRLGARAALRRRAACRRCGHDLTGLSVTDHAVVCTECGTPSPAVAGWGEVQTTPTGAAFRPATDLVRVFWTRRRIVLAAKATAAFVSLAAAIWGGVWGYRSWDSHRQASQARAARLSAEEINARINQGRERPTQTTGTGTTRRDLLRRIANRLSTLTDSYNQQHGLQGVSGPKQMAWVENYAPLRPSSDPDDAANSPRAAELLELARGAGLFDALDQLAAAADDRVDRPFVPADARVQPDPVFGHLRAASRLNAARIRLALDRGDLEEFRRSITAALALSETADGGTWLIDRLVAIAQWRSTLEHLEAVIRRRPEAPWLDEVERALAARTPRPIAEAFERERLIVLDNLAIHFSDAARVRRGMSDPVIEDAPDFTALFGSGDRTERPEPPARLGTFDENTRGLNAFFDALIETSRRPGWRPHRYDDPATGSDDLYFVRQIVSLVYALRTDDRLELFDRAVRVSLRIARFELAHGRVPTTEEFASLFADDPNAVDPFSGRLFGYRTENLPPIAAERGYLLWSVGLDGVDDGGKIHERMPDAALRAAGAGFDAPLPAF